MDSCTMLSQENKVILFSILVLLPFTLLVLRVINNWYELPRWVAGVAPLVVAVLLPQLYLRYTAC